MAPPTPILTPEEVSRGKEWAHKLNKKDKCELKSLTQHLCHADEPGKYICVPFKRVFEQCLGRAVEITDSDTNNP